MHDVFAEFLPMLEHVVNQSAEQDDIRAGSQGDPDVAIADVRLKRGSTWMTARPRSRASMTH